MDPKVRHPFRIDSTEIERLGPDSFVRIMNRLLMAEARRQRIPTTDVATSLRIYERDKGIDARVRAGDAGGDWIPCGLSVWQFKAGAPPEPAKIKKEVAKPGVREALKAGGTYVLALAADPISEKRENLKTSLQQAVDAVQPGATFLLMSASDLAAWATDHPAFLFDFGRPVQHFWSVGQWLKQQSVHQVPWHPDPAREAVAETARRALASDSGPIHVRIEGQAGVGKSRLALELFREDGEDVLYAPDPPADDAIFRWVAEHEGAQLVLVVDECTATQARRLQQLAEMSGRRLRLLTVGQEDYASESPHVYRLEPLDDEAMLAVVQAAARTLPDDQARWVVGVARGFVKLATALAVAVAKGRLTALELTSTYDVRAILRALLPEPEALRGLRGLALLTRVGWDGEVASEGIALAAFVGMDWNAMRDAIGRLLARGIVAKRGRYRYVTPEILALWLAADVWQGRGSELLELLNQLPNAEAQDALIRRIVHLRGLPEVDAVIDDLLGPTGPFDTLAALNNERAAELFSSLAHAHPVPAIEALERVLLPATQDELLALERGRRHIVWTLQRLLESRDTFFGAARLLRRLAEAENERWGNNATGVWADIFLTRLGPTEVPAIERYVLLDEALDASDPATRLLGVAGIGHALSTSEFGSPLGEPAGGYAPPERWRPRTYGEDRACRRAALRRLDRALADRDSQVRTEAREVLFHKAQGLARIGLTPEITDRFETLELHNGKERRDAWEAARAVLRYEEESLTPEQRERLTAFADQLIGNSLSDRLRRYVGRWSHVDWREGTTDEHDRLEQVAAALADEAINQPDELRAMLPWLTSSEAEHAFLFGQRLGRLDEHRTWLVDILRATEAGENPRLLSTYLRGRAEAGDAAWREELLDAWAQDPARAPMVFDATWQGPTSLAGAQRLARLVERGWLPPIQLSLLVWGAWAATLPTHEVAILLRQLARDASANATEAGLEVLVQWVQGRPTGLPRDLQAIAWQFLERPSAREVGQVLASEWATVGRLLARTNPPRAARAVLRFAQGGEFSYRNERFQVLKTALTVRPEPVWELIGRAILRDRTLALELGWWAQEAKLLNDLDPPVVLDWARREPHARPQLLAHFVKPRGEMTPLVRGLLAAYGPAGPVAGALAANFQSGTSWGRWAEQEERLIAAASAWLNDPEPNVREWARTIVANIRRRLPEIRRDDEERDLP